MKLICLITVYFGLNNILSFGQGHTMKLDYEHEYVSTYSNGLASVRIDDHYGFLNEQGELVIPAIYDHTDHFHNGVSVVDIDGVHFVIDKTGTKISDEYETAHRSGYVFDPNEIIHIQKNGKWGVLDTLANELVPCIYSNPPRISKDRIVVEDDDGETSMRTFGNKILIPGGVYDEIYRMSDYFFCVRSDSASFFSNDGVQLTRFKYGDHLLPKFSGNYITATLSNSVFYHEILSNDLKVIITRTSSYDHIRDNYFLVRDKNGTYGVLDIETGVWKSKFGSMHVYVYDKNHLEFSTRDGKKGIMDIDGNILISSRECSFHEPDRFGKSNEPQEIVIIDSDEEFNNGFYSLSTGFKSPIAYEYIQISDCGKFVSATKDKITTVYDLNGKILGENFFTGHQATIHNGYLSVKSKEGKYGLVEFK